MVGHSTAGLIEFTNFVMSQKTTHLHTFALGSLQQFHNEVSFPQTFERSTTLGDQLEQRSLLRAQ